MFAIRLAVESRSPLVSRLRTGAGLSVIEPWGVVKLTYETYSALEGQTVREMRGGTTRRKEGEEECRQREIEYKHY